MADRDGKDLSGATKMNRRGLLKCMAWTGTGVVWTLSGGVPRTLGLIGGAAAAEAPQGALTFVQISDSHIGFHLPPRPRPKRHAHRGNREDQGDADAARLSRPYRRHQPPLQGG